MKWVKYSRVVAGVDAKNIKSALVHVPSKLIAFNHIVLYIKQKNSNHVA